MIVHNINAAIFAEIDLKKSKKFVLVLLTLALSTLFVSEGTSAPSPFFPKPDLIIMKMKAPQEAHAGDELGGRIEVTILNQGTADVEGGYTLDFFISFDRKFSGKTPVLSTTYVDDALFTGGRVRNMPALATEATYSFTHNQLPLMPDIPIGSTLR